MHLGWPPGPRQAPRTAPAASSYARAVPTVGPRALTTFRVLAWITGVLLVVNVFIASPLKYLGDHPGPAELGWQVHGWAYAAYFVSAAFLAYRLRWGVWRAVLVLLAGTVPFASFVAERKVVAEVRTVSPASEPVRATPAARPDGRAR